MIGIRDTVFYAVRRQSQCHKTGPDVHLIGNPMYDCHRQEQSSTCTTLWLPATGSLLGRSFCSGHPAIAEEGPDAIGCRSRSWPFNLFLPKGARPFCSRSASNASPPTFGQDSSSTESMAQIHRSGMSFRFRSADHFSRDKSRFRPRTRTVGDFHNFRLMFLSGPVSACGFRFSQHAEMQFAALVRSYLFKLCSWADIRVIVS